MHIELLPGLENVIRFPIERRARPTLELLREIAPDSREVSLTALAFGLEEPPHDLRRVVDRRTAEHILNEVPSEPGEVRTAMLAGMLEPLVAAAVEACRVSHDTSCDLVAAQRLLLEAESSGSLWTEKLGERADALSVRSAELLIEAHLRYEEVEGAARAVEGALRGEPWTPYDPREVSEWLASAGPHH